MYKIVLRGQAAKQVQDLPSNYFRLIRQHIDELANDPRPPGVQKLAAGAGYRIRVGDYRILYDIDDTARLVTIYRVKHRREVYR